MSGTISCGCKYGAYPLHGPLIMETNLLAKIFPRDFWHQVFVHHFFLSFIFFLKVKYCCTKIHKPLSNFILPSLKSYLKKWVLNIQFIQESNWTHKPEGAIWLVCRKITVEYSLTKKILSTEKSTLEHLQA